MRNIEIVPLTARWLSLAGGALLALLAAAPRVVVADEPDHWFVSHLDNEVCVPLSAIRNDLTLGHDGAGNMATPADLEAYFRRQNWSIQRLPPTIPGMVGMQVTNQHDWGVYALFNNLDLCRRIMEAKPRSSP